MACLRHLAPKRIILRMLLMDSDIEHVNLYCTRL